MGAIRASGLASGLDTNAIADELVKAAKVPINQLNINLHKVSLTKTMFNDFNNDISGIRSALLNLKLSSTFNGKSTTVSNTSVLSARASTTANPGTYTVEVLQSAKNATFSSKYTRARLAVPGAGVTGTSGVPSKYDQLEGLHNVTVSEHTNGEWIAESVFTASNKNLFTEQKGSVIASANINQDGTLAAAISGTVDFTINQSGASPVTVSVNVNASAGSSIHSVLAAMEKSLNEQLNTQFGTKDTQYTALRAQYTSPDEWNVSIYNVSDKPFTVSAADSAGSVVTELGLGNLPSSATTVSSIVKHHVAADSAALTTQLKTAGTGIINNFTLATDGLTEGNFVIVQDSSSNTRMATKTKLEGTHLTIFEGAGAYTVTDILGSGAAPLNGTFQINNTTITIENAQNKSINDILAIVNSSGAGVTMSFDRAAERFTLTSNNTGVASINVTEGTSKLLSTFNLTAGKGAVKTLGTTNGALDTSAKINSAGFSAAVANGVFTVNGVPIYVDAAKDSIDDLLNKVNKSAAGVTMMYDSVQDKFAIISKSIDPIRLGSANDSTNFLVSAGLVHVDDVKTEKVYGEAGQNAVISVDGRTYHRSSNTIEDVIPGISINAMSKGISTIEVSVNTDNAVDALATFVKSYNEIIQKLNPDEITREERRDKMEPLTDEEKDAMSDEEIKKYETEYDRLHTIDIMSKQMELKQLKDGLRKNIMDVLGSTSSTMFKSLSDVGMRIAGEGNIEITRYGYLMTTSTNLDDIKKAITDNSTLMNNLRNNPEEVYRFFGDYDETVEKSGKITVNQDSWARRYERMLINMQDVDGPIGGKIRVNGALDRQMQRIQDQIDRKTTSVEKYLERLWSQFTAMETRIAEVNSQASYIERLSAAASASAK